jgi:outer membrane translocation and assembly module TamA
LLKRLLICVCVLASLPLNGQTYRRVRRPTTTTIRSILFENAGVLSTQERREFAKRIRREDDSPKDASVIAQELVRTAYQDKGYFKAQVKAAAGPVAQNASKGQVDIVIKVVDSGRQYRLREIHFINAKAFLEEELVRFIPVQPGEIFRRDRIAKGLELLSERYESSGYLNFTSIPNTEFDEADATVRLNIDVDEGKLFHWGELHVTGLDAAKTQELTDGWEDLRGRSYSPDSLREFCGRFFHPTPAGTDPAEYTKREIDQRMGTVDISIEFATPPWISD